MRPTRCMHRQVRHVGIRLLREAAQAHGPGAVGGAPVADDLDDAMSDASSSSSDTAPGLLGAAAVSASDDEAAPLASLHDALELMTAAAAQVDGEEARGPVHGLPSLDADAAATELVIPAGEDLLLVGRVSALIDGVLVVRVRVIALASPAQLGPPCARTPCLDRM